MKIRKNYNFLVLYRSPSQSQDDFETFLKNLELNLDIILPNNPSFSVVLGGFNIKSTHHTRNLLLAYLPRSQI